MAKDGSRICELCGKETINPLMGWGAETPIAMTHWFCSGECRTEFAIAEIANQRGVEYKIRNYKYGKNIEYREELSEEDIKMLEKGKILELTQRGESVMMIYMDPFGDIKKW